MERGRTTLFSRGKRWIVAYRDRLSPTEADSALPPNLGRRAITALDREAQKALVDAYGGRFPNERPPVLTDRVTSWVDLQVASGALAVVEAKGATRTEA